MKNRASGFTLMEIIITTILVGVVASLAFSNYGVVIEKMRAKEGEQTLRAAIASIKRYEVEHNNQSPPTFADTDFDLPNSENFGPVTCPTLARCFVTRSTGDYMIRLMPAAPTVFTCTGLTAKGVQLCPKLGY